MRTSHSEITSLHQILLFIILSTPWFQLGITQELLIGFSATPDSSISTFQPLLKDPTGNFSLVFLRVNQSQLALAILHFLSSEPVWIAKTSTSVKWSKSTQLIFDGRLTLSDRKAGVFWSTHSNGGDRLLLLNNSNLQIQQKSHIIWQSFDFPSDTLIGNQNFTSTMSLVNGGFSMSLGDDFLGLYASFKPDSNQIYWKHTAMQAKAAIVKGKGSIYARISSNGFLGMYQTEAAPVDVLPFDSFQRTITGIRRLKLESDGNLKGYFWNGSIWVNEFVAITNDCELPSSCGLYSLCEPGKSCSCLDDQKDYDLGECFSPESSNLCADTNGKRDDYWILRRKGVELPYKELMAFEQMGSLDDCESSCERNCSCWGALFNNASGYCYKVDYLINTLVSVGDESKLGYFKVPIVAEKKRLVSVAVGVVILVGAISVFIGVVGYVSYRVWRRKRRGRLNSGFFENGLSPGSYRDLGSSSFGSVELSKS
ncbi:hypothetical protein GIB67_023204 [Kingdonia uniflora]|uniref:Apple domain-containing protein n=1 Tax=Kingdonia uniflora TaxID=39325 RepID=A0A7J7MCJ9_9MAGN|nr:hypothetical protein GIB67_023204 [Kingdonia uniflora]